MTLRELFTYRIFTVSNVLSLSRIFLLPLLWYTMQLEDFDLSNKYSIGILMFMILTDYLDGLLARKLGQETPLGQYLDPVADKFAIVGGLALLVWYRSFPAWVVIFIFIREVLGTWLGGFLLIKRNVLGKPNYWGKFGVGFCALAGVFYLLRLPYAEYSIVPIVVTFIGGIIVYSRTYWRTVFKVYE